MNVTPKLALGFWNAWLLCAPMVVLGILVVLPRKQLAKRLSDMTDYGTTERGFTVAASLLPYLLIAAAAWTPLPPVGPRLLAGLLVSAFGTLGFFRTLRVFAKAPPDQLLVTGPFQISRNPLYVSAALAFLGACLASGSPLLSSLLLVLLVLQHRMILAEERACAKRYGDAYAAYARHTARYLGWR
jgi:protein-S-isoprenylcysteine O-methyltransferase Ste14